MKFTDPRHLGSRNICSFSDIVGKTLTKVENDSDDELYFYFSDGSFSRMWHDQDCCEHVGLVEGYDELSALIGSPLLIASEETNQDNPPEHPDSWTWTFYKLATLHANATLRWLGESNGYYSESVDFALFDPISYAIEELTSE
jgi:hypothetical protein